MSYRVDGKRREAVLTGEELICNQRVVAFRELYGHIDGAMFLFLLAVEVYFIA